MREESLYETAEWLDGPRFCAWLKTRRRIVGNRGNGESPDGRLSANDQRRIYDWRQGAAASFYTASALLLKLEIGEHEIPDDVFLETKTKPGFHSVTHATRQQILSLYQSRRKDAVTLAHEHGISPGTVHRWAREQEA